MNRIFFSLLALTLLASCGGNDDNQAVATPYAYTQGGYGYDGHRMCTQRVLRDWERLVAMPCSRARGPGDQWCAQGIHAFMHNPANASEIQGPGCGVPTASTRWCPGDGWRKQAYYDINVNMLQAYLTQFGGPGSWR
jgi:hypothetical protein